MTSWLIINIITTFIIIVITIIIIIIIITRKSSQILSEATNDKLVDYPISSLRPLAFPSRRGKRDSFVFSFIFKETSYFSFFIMSGQRYNVRKLKQYRGRTKQVG